MLIRSKNALRPVWQFLYWNAICRLESVSYTFAINLIRKFPIFSKALRRPKGFYSSVYNWSSDNQISQLQNLCIEEVCVGFKAKFNLKAQKPESDPILYDSFEPNYPPALVAVIPGGYVYGDCGVVLSPDEYLLGDLSVEFELVRDKKDLSHHSILQVLNLPKPVHLKGNVALLASQAGSYNYFHWMFDVLPKIYLLRKSSITMEDIDIFACNQRPYSYHRETLSILGIPESKIFEISPNSYLRADRLICTSPPSIQSENGRPPISEWLYTFLRSEFLQEITCESYLPKRIYVNRRDSSRRALTNEDEVESTLAKYGFESISLSHMSVRDQARIFNNAEIVVAPHGAGLTNLVFCSPYTKVIEIFLPPDKDGNWGGVTDFYHLSTPLKLDYFYLLSDEKYLLTDTSIVDRRMVVNVDKLLEVLRLANISQ